MRAVHAHCGLRNPGRPARVRLHGMHHGLHPVVGNLFVRRAAHRGQRRLRVPHHHGLHNVRCHVQVHRVQLGDLQPHSVVRHLGAGHLHHVHGHHWLRHLQHLVHLLDVQQRLVQPDPDIRRHNLHCVHCHRWLHHLRRGQRDAVPVHSLQRHHL